jgi:outer membrane protein insertion porin family
VVGRLFPAAFLLLLLPAASAQISLPAGAGPRATGIRDVTFDHVSALSSDQQQAIVRKLQYQSAAWLGQQTPDSLARFVGATALQAYQDNGYWRAKISADATWVRGEGADHPVDVRITAIDEGEQYWVKDIHWTGATVFPENELSRAFSLRPWELMTRTREEAGIDAVRRLYFARGYLAATVNPQMQFDDAAHSVALTLAVEEDKLFYFRNLSVAGLNRESTRQLESGWEQMRAQPYSAQNLREFFERYYQPRQPGTDPLEFSTSNINLDTHTVDIQISFTPVTQAEKTTQ